jgi:hypothetical protein
MIELNDEDIGMAMQDDLDSADGCQEKDQPMFDFNMRWSYYLPGLNYSKDLGVLN